MNTTKPEKQEKQDAIDYKSEKAVANMFPLECRVDDSAGVTATVKGYIQAPAHAPDAGEWRLELQYITDGPTPGVKARTCKRTERKAGTPDEDDKDKGKKKDKTAAE